MRWLAIVVTCAGCGEVKNGPDDGGAGSDGPGSGSDSGSGFDVAHVGPADERIGTVDLVIPTTQTFDTQALTVNGMGGVDFTVAAQEGGGPDVAVLHLKSLTIMNAALCPVIGSRPLVIVAEQITIEGALDAGGKRTTQGPGAVLLGAGNPAQIGGVPIVSGGGGGGGFGGSGGRGGDAIGVPGGSGGTGSQDPSLGVLVGGSPGGDTGAQNCTGSGGGAAGGGGGGVIQLSASVKITINGRVNAGGGGGITCGLLGGGGGGSGGALYLQAPELEGGGIVAATGGGGGGGSNSSTGQQGGDGVDGNDTTQARGGAAAQGAGFGGNGGNTADGNPATGANANAGNGGGGGGAAGRVVIKGATSPANLAIAPAPKLVP